MFVNLIKCDRCGSSTEHNIDSHFHRICIDLRSHSDAWDVSTDQTDYDLCDFCFTELKKFLEDHTNGKI